ncbi:MAG: hypothetical protein QOD29_2441 [Alphaproteobacteria bacterium]|nr:hypothetical protein [Alphaproteobacteria bacterium]
MPANLGSYDGHKLVRGGTGICRHGRARLA